MLTEEQQAAPLEGLTGADAIIMLQIILRFISSGLLQDVELDPVAMCRRNLVSRLKKATDIDFDQVRSQALAQAQAKK